MEAMKAAGYAAEANAAFGDDNERRADLGSEPAKKRNVLFVQESPCIRNYKMATALRKRGHRVTLAYGRARLSQVYPGLSDDVYDELIHLDGFRELWDIAKGFDVVHCHNEPDFLTVAALGCAGIPAEAGEPMVLTKKIKRIHFVGIGGAGVSALAHLIDRKSVV